MRHQRRLASLILAIALTLPFVSLTSLKAQDEDFVVTLLGTGTPPPLMDRFGPATLVEVGGRMFLFDTGRGATQQMWRLGRPFGQLDAVLLTHLHSDHVVGLPDIWLTGWLRGPYGQRDNPLVVMGPQGTENLTSNLMEAYSWDIDTRVEDQNMSREAAQLIGQNVPTGVIYDQDGVVITAFENNHGELIHPSYGYRIDYDGRSAVISGDTKRVQSLIDAATGVDLLVHSIGAARQELLDAAPVWQLIMDHHIQPEDAGQVFSDTRPGLAVFTHVVNLTNGQIPPVTAEEIMERAGTTYDGPLVMGQDLMRIVIGNDEVIAIPFEG